MLPKRSRKKKSGIWSRHPMWLLATTVAVLYPVAVVLVPQTLDSSLMVPLLGHASGSLNLTRVGGFCPATECPLDIRHTRIREAWGQAPHLPNEIQANKRNKWVDVPLPGSDNDTPSAATFKMLLRDTATDTFISGTLAKGQVHDPHIRSIVERVLRNKQASTERTHSPVMVDVGANIGYFSLNALALGATVISFEPFRLNMGSLMSSVQANQWQDRSFLYMNAVSYESTRVLMRTTNAKINESNMHITNKQCQSETHAASTNETYGLDYMEAVSLDQVMLTKHTQVTYVNLMKIDVETFEVEVLEGAMHFLCHRVVERIVMEVAYLGPRKNEPPPTCRFQALHDTLAQLGYTTWDPAETRNLTGLPLASLTGDVVFRLEHTQVPPAVRLEDSTKANPCRDFTL